MTIEIVKLISTHLASVLLVLAAGCGTVKKCLAWQARLTAKLLPIAFARGSTTMRLSEVTALLMDMDGVIYRGHEIILGTPEFLNALSQRKIDYAFITNSSVMSADQHRERLRKIGVNVENAILTSGWATRQHLVRDFDKGTSVLVIGSDALREEILGDSYFIETSESPTVVVVGHDRKITYEKCVAAARAIRNGAHFIGTNPDSTVPSENGLVPETGALLSYLTAATNVNPIVVGKPSPIMFELALARTGAVHEKTLVIGDRIDTDIAGARAAGLASALVLTGVTRSIDLPNSPIQPDYVFENLTCLLEALYS